MEGSSEIPAQYNRFIPNRAAMDINSARFLMKGGVVNGVDSFGGAADGSSTSSSGIESDRMEGLVSAVTTQDSVYQEKLAKACGVDLNTKILSFARAPPALDEVDKLPSAVLMGNRIGSRISGTGALAKRNFQREPSKVLDAPGMVDDYYLHLLDWSSQNTLGVVLGESVFLWDASTSGVCKLLDAPEQCYTASLKFSADGSFLALGTSQGKTQVWDVRSRKRIRTMEGHAARVGVLAWNGHVLCSGSLDGTIWHHDVRVKEHRVLEMRGHASEVCGIDWRVDGQMLASGGNDNLVQIWDSRLSNPIHTKADHKSAIKAVAWCPWETSVLATGGGSQDRHVHFWNSTTGNKLYSIDANSQVTGIIWSKHYKELLTTHGFPDNHLSLWHYRTLRKIGDLEGHDARVLYSSLSPDGETVVTGAPDHTLKFWHLWEVKQKAQNKVLGKYDYGGSLQDHSNCLNGKPDIIDSHLDRVNIR